MITSDFRIDVLMPIETTLLAAGKKQVSALTEWLAGQPDTIPPETLVPRVSGLLEFLLTPAQKFHLLETLFARLSGSVGLDVRIAPLIGIPVPLSRTDDQRTRTLLNLIDDFAQGFEETLDALPDNAVSAAGKCLERIIFFLYKHLCVSYLVRRPVALGIWQRLNNAALRSFRTRTGAPLAHYAKALLLSSAEPLSLTSRELTAVVYYMQRITFEEFAFSGRQPGHLESAFWIPTQQNLRPFPMTRCIPPEESGALFFSCPTLVKRVWADLAALESESPSATLPLPPRDSRNLLRHLAECWEHPKPRRFHRRRKSFRGLLRVGFGAIRETLEHNFARAEDTATRWMATNESQSGHGLMLLSGVPDGIFVGNLIAFRPEQPGKGKRPIIGLIRWMASESPENLEVGTQLLSNRAIPVNLSPFDAPEASFPALLLPKEPGRDKAFLVTPVEASSRLETELLLQTGTEAPRRIRLEGLCEQTPYVDILTFSEHVQSA